MNFRDVANNIKSASKIARHASDRKPTLIDRNSAPLTYAAVTAPQDSNDLRIPIPTGRRAERKSDEEIRAQAESLGDSVRSAFSRDEDDFTPSNEEGKDMFGNDLFTTLDHPRRNQTAQNPLAGAMRYTDDEDLTGLDYTVQAHQSTPEKDYWNRIYYDTEEAPKDSAIYTDNSMSGNEELIRDPEYVTWFDIANGDWLDENRGAPRQSQTAQNPLGGAMRFHTSYYDNSGVIDPRNRTGDEPRQVLVGTDPDTGDPIYSEEADNGSWYIDNGTNDPEHRRSPYIQGAEIMRLQDQGALPDLGFVVDPYLVYDKTWLHDNTDFPMPWVPDQETASNYAAFDYGSMPAQWAGNLTNHRELIGQAVGNDYDMTVDGTTVSGHEFDTNANAYYNQVRYYMEHDPSRFATPPDDGGYTAFVQTFHLPNANGEEEVHQGTIVDSEYVDGGILRVYFSDGLYEDLLYDQAVIGDKVNDDFFNRNVFMEPYSGDPSDLDGLNDDYVNGDAESPTVQYVPNLTFSDGGSLNYMQVETALDDIEHEGGSRSTSNNFQGDVDISYDNRDMWDNRAFEGDEFFDEEGLHLDPTMVGDTLAQSLPYMAWQVGVPVGVSQAVSASAYGLDPYSYDPNTGSYRLIRPAVDAYGNVYNDMNMEHSIISPLATAGMFMTERIAGNVGPSVAKNAVRRWVAKKPTLGRAAAGHGVDIAGEGVEENISGLTFEELQRNGAIGWQANPTGQYDVYGNDVLDTGTSASDRLENYADLQQRANEFLGGAVVGGIMSAPQAAHDYRNGFNTSRLVNAYRNANGNIEPIHVTSEGYVERQNEAIENNIKAKMQEILAEQARQEEIEEEE